MGKDGILSRAIAIPISGPGPGPVRIPRPPAKHKACGSHAPVCGKSLLIARISAEFLGIIRDVEFY